MAHNWYKIYPRGSGQWDALIKCFLEHKVILDPTMTAYIAGRGVRKARNVDWMQKYMLPSLNDFYVPNRLNHGSCFYNWTNWEEVAWEIFYRIWMSFLNDYKNAGGLLL